MLLAANRKLIYFLATRNRFSVLFTVNTVQFLVMSETSINIHIQRETTSDDDGIIRQSADEG